MEFPYNLWQNKAQRQDVFLGSATSILRIELGGYFLFWFYHADMLYTRATESATYLVRRSHQTLKRQLFLDEAWRYKMTIPLFSHHR